ncbi:cytochrome P450 [Fistulina hepatica ATCC 64428]|uniref:Cytochrome P450 n=1 Tax=Fistulina hepatica ATCC 64428 TaxID=1128425 RepID=A0A0D7ACA5_9AGAR|nr:cytochrome P450 [Fistulina hepatica ATCC 64428]
MSSYIVSFILFLLPIFLSYLFSRNSGTYPPGPRRLWFSDIDLRILNVKPWLTYFRMSADYNSQLVSFRIHNRRIVVLNGLKSIHDLLNKRAAIYSERPRSWMYHDLCERKLSMFNISARDQRHKQYRELFQAGLGPRSIQQFAPLLQGEVERLMNNLHLNPEGYSTHFRRYVVSCSMKIAYGYEVSDENDPFVSAAEETNRISGWALAPGWLVDAFPIVRYVPSWFPLADFKRQANAWRIKLKVLSDVPHEWTKRKMSNHDLRVENFTSRLLCPDGVHFVDDVQDEIVKWCAGGMYAGSADTTFSALISFILLMALVPDVQARAREEVLQLLTDGCLPRLEDIRNLRYVLAILKETLRFAPVSNLALPHCASEDNIYDGLLIPKGSVVIPNVWSVMHDPDLYPDPELFLPERFLEDGGGTNPDPRNFAFGFGRRTCPGQVFAETTMLLVMASILSRFRIHAAVSSQGPNPTATRSLDVDFTTGITSHIKPFPVTLSHL